MVNNPFPRAGVLGSVAAFSTTKAAPALIRPVKEIENQSFKFSKNTCRIHREGRTLLSTAML
jgi:hypothetical protein